MEKNTRTNERFKISSINIQSQNEKNEINNSFFDKIGQNFVKKK